MTITEAVLQEWVLCPLYRSAGKDADEVFETGSRLLRWAILERFNGGLLPLPSLRDRFTHMLDENRVQKRDSVYYDKVRAGISIARKVYDFVLHHEVMRPEQPYELSFAGHEVVGHYAMVRRNTGNQHPMVLVTSSTRTRRSFAHPEITGLCRYLHAIMQAGDEPIGIYYLPLIWGVPWKHMDVNEPLVHQWVGNILDSVCKRNSVYPTPGTHCEKCTAPCMRVFQ